MTQQVSPTAGSPERSSNAGAAYGGKYMTFKLANEEYGLEILKVREIIGLMDITRVPRTAKFIQGVINLRGKVIPVIDLRLKFGMSAIQPTDQTVIIVVQYLVEGGERTMGVLVDEVLEVRSIEAAQIDSAPDFGAGGTETEFIMGVGKVESRIIFLLDIGKVLTVQESAASQRVSSNGWLTDSEEQMATPAGAAVQPVRGK